jgi:hypothetical protein
MDEMTPGEFEAYLLEGVPAPEDFRPLISLAWAAVVPGVAEARSEELTEDRSR